MKYGRDRPDTPSNRYLKGYVDPTVGRVVMPNATQEEIDELAENNPNAKNLRPATPEEIQAWKQRKKQEEKDAEMQRRKEEMDG